MKIGIKIIIQILLGYLGLCIIKYFIPDIPINSVGVAVFPIIVVCLYIGEIIENQNRILSKLNK